MNNKFIKIVISILIIISMTSAFGMTPDIVQRHNILNVTQKNQTEIPNNVIASSPSPALFIITNPSVSEMDYCEGCNLYFQSEYIIVPVQILSASYSNWANVPVRVRIYDYEGTIILDQTKKTNSKGMAGFSVGIDQYKYYDSFHSHFQIDIVATSPKTGRKVHSVSNVIGGCDTWDSCWDW